MSPRWISTKVMNAAENLAVEEAIFQLQEGITIRVWESEKSVVIGRAQLAAYETDLERCRTHGIAVVRRFTAGGAVYNGPGNVNWSIFVSNGFESGSIRFEREIRGLFRLGASVAVESLRCLGVRSWLDEPNRILTEQGKVSGMAAYLSKNRVVVHGTMLLNANLQEASELTLPKDGVLEQKYVRSRSMKIANVGVDSRRFVDSMRKVAAENLGREPEDSPPSDAERELSRELMEKKYSKRDWNLGDPFAQKA